VRLAASFRLLSKVKVANDQIDSPETAANHLSFIKNNEEESFVVLHLDTKNKVTKKETISTGTINSSIVHPREVFKSAIRESTASIILGHNHPSGIVDPSHEDIQTTRRLVDAGELLGIRVLDHIIVAGDKHLSLKERGHM
jgi:DNA repair protein RadC